MFPHHAQALAVASTAHESGAIRSNPVLEVFRMGDNGVSAEGGQELLDALNKKAKSGKFSYEVFVRGQYFRNDPNQVQSPDAPRPKTPGKKS